MTETIKVIATGILAGLVVLIGGSMFGGGPAVGGVYEITEQFFEGGIDVTGEGAIQVDNTTVIDASGNVDAPITTTSLKTGASGTTLDQVVCANSEWDPGVVASTSVATLDVTLTGFGTNDALFASLASSTSGLVLNAVASTTNVARLILSQPDWDAVAVNLASSTLKVCAVST